MDDTAGGSLNHNWKRNG